MTRWRISDATAFVVSDLQRVVVYNLEAPTAQPLALLGTGATIWRSLVGSEDDLRPWREEPDLLAGLAEAHGVEPVEIRDDVESFLQRMTAGGYVRTGT